MFFYMVLDLELNAQKRDPFSATTPGMASIIRLS